jgi:hypothetical protein
MSSLTVEVPGRGTVRANENAARRWALGGLAVGAVSSITFAVITVTMTLSTITDRDLTFHHTGDYWYTAIGIPTAAATATLLFALWRLQPQARPALTRAGVTMNAVALAMLAVLLACSVATGAEVRWGGAYIIATLVTFVGHALFVAGTWRTGLLPKPLLAAWPAVWLIGAFAAQGISPLLLAAFYATVAVLVLRRTR